MGRSVVTYGTSEIEDMLLVQIKMAKLPEPEQQWNFVPGRRYRCDFAWPGHKTIVEVEGGTWNGGRHVTGAGFERDCEKYNLAALHGYRVFRVTSSMVRDGRALATIEQALEGK